MNFDLAVDWNQVDEIGFKALPAGDYAGKITEVVMKQTKDQTGQYIKLAFTLMGEGVGKRKIFTNINVKNKNEDATKIGLGRLKKLLLLAGIDPSSFTDTQQLNGAVVGLKVIVRPASGDYGEQNDVKDYLPFHDALLEKHVTEESSF